MFINTSGGLTGGDSLSCSATVTGSSTLTLTTQAAERLYRASSGVAEVRNTLTLDENTTLDWLPQETILFDGSALHR